MTPTKFLPAIALIDQLRACGAGLMTLLCGLLGLPPVNGVLPQSPMHTKALARVAGKSKMQPQRAASQELGEVGAMDGTKAVGVNTASSRLHASGSTQALLPTDGGAENGSVPSAPQPAGPVGAAAA